MAAIAASGMPNATKLSIIKEAANPTGVGGFVCMLDKDVVRIRRIGLKFDANGKLVGATDQICQY